MPCYFPNKKYFQLGPERRRVSWSAPRLLQSGQDTGRISPETRCVLVVVRHMALEPVCRWTVIRGTHCPATPRIPPRQLPRALEKKTSALSFVLERKLSIVLVFPRALQDPVTGLQYPQWMGKQPLSTNTLPNHQKQGALKENNREECIPYFQD